jgi:hypothetical protein
MFVTLQRKVSKNIPIYRSAKMETKPFSQNFYFYCLVCFVASLPFSINHFQIGNFFMYALLGASFFNYSVTKHTNRKIRLIAVLMAALFVMHVVGLLRTDNWQQAQLELETKIGLVVFPLIFFFSPVLDATRIRLVLQIFVGVCTVTMLYCLVIAVWRYQSNPGSTFLVYHELSGIANMRANYLAMYLCFSILITILLFRPELYEMLTRKGAVFFAALVIPACGIILLSSRIHILFLVAAVVLIGIKLLRRHVSVKKSLVISIVAGTILLAAVFLVPHNRERFKESINYYENRWGEGQIRGSIWTCSIQLIAINPMRGVGTGDSRDELEQCYLRNDFSWLFHWEGIRFNAHNQYLETTLELGVPALIILLALLGACLVHGISSRNYVIIYFMALVVISCLTESILERQKGIFFFAFFASFLLLNFGGSGSNNLKSSSNI